MAFRADVAEGVGFVAPDTREVTVDDAVRTFLFEHLRNNKGREEKTVKDYWRLYQKWFSPVFGNRAVRSITLADLDMAFGKMQQAGLSSSRLNHGRSLFKPSSDGRSRTSTSPGTRCGTSSSQAAPMCRARSRPPRSRN